MKAIIAIIVEMALTIGMLTSHDLVKMSLFGVAVIAIGIVIYYQRVLTDLIRAWRFF